MAERSYETDIPARLDRLPWQRFHWLVIAALGITWILDGLEVTLVGSLSGAFAGPNGLSMSESQIGFAASAYLAGAILGALGFGQLTDLYGRKRLFSITVLVYAAATIATGFSWNFVSFAVFRFGTGAGIGGEYAAINSAIDELIPARARGWTDLAVNGTFWIGAALGAGSSLALLDPRLLPPWLGWRLAFGIGGALGLGVVMLRRLVPESPRWLMTHGRLAEAERVVREIEARVGGRAGALPRPAGKPIRLVPRGPVSLVELATVLLRRYPRRTLLGLTLMAAQAFCYNAVFFTYALVLRRFYAVPADRVGAYILAFAAGNFLGPLLLGRLFDTIGRRVMITLTYGLAGALMAATALLFAFGALGAADQTALWTAIFFIASAAASAAYLTVGETFPLELRALIIALFYAFGAAIGGIAGPSLFGILIQSGSRDALMWGYLLAAGLMVGAAAVEGAIGVNAERRSLEDIAAPLSMDL
ncbi:MAG: MFS transporter [Alphaproteobacteria bacterium]|nr:MFS transporter [Alphaproteobacteria bacterium]